MEHLAGLKKKILEFPASPGVYLIKGADGRPIYIGKANGLRARLLSHFRSNQALKEDFIQRDARDIEIVQTASEAEALLLEASLVKQHSPRYNQELKDDKSYPFLKVTMEEEYPRLLVVRGRPSDGSVYFGPYTNLRLLHQAVSFLRRLFPMRTCNVLPKKVCLMYHIGQCRGPCEKYVTKGEYRELVKELVLFLEGRRGALLKHLGRKMQEASKARHFEEARIYRDQIQALSTISILRSPLNRVTVLEEMQTKFSLARYPRRIEAFDISNFTGKNPVGSLVVFEDGAPKRSDYRKFKIKTVQGIDDYQMMKEVVRRRYERLLNEKTPLPDLILIDGGKGHLAAAKEELDNLNLADLDILSIAKQHEYLFKPHRPQPYVLPQDSAILQLLRHVRDEAHRFAISFYRSLHKKSIAWSELDDVPGIGPKKKATLIKAFKSVAAVKTLSAEALAAAPGIDLKAAKNIEDYFKKR